MNFNPLTIPVPTNNQINNITFMNSINIPNQ